MLLFYRHDILCVNDYRQIDSDSQDKLSLISLDNSKDCLEAINSL